MYWGLLENPRGVAGYSAVFISQFAGCDVTDGPAERWGCFAPGPEIASTWDVARREAESQGVESIALAGHLSLTLWQVWLWLFQN
jgi:hypothetical protein